MLMVRPRPLLPPRPSPGRPPPVLEPIGIKYDTVDDSVVRHGRRALLRGIAIGRSLKIESPLLSMPVVIVYGAPLLASRFSCTLRLRSAWLDTEPRTR